MAVEALSDLARCCAVQESPLMPILTKPFRDSLERQYTYPNFAEICETTAALAKFRPVEAEET